MYAWSGIPYAKPPLGELRFEPPQSLENWTGIWNATYGRNSCIGISLLDLLAELITPMGDEDCLYINVYAPQPPQKSSRFLPVMVWIYGGEFLEGNSSYALYNPRHLVQEGSIVVSFNYRLGIFGFISTYDNVAPGNIGIKDQIMALKWVRNNIRAFGGDPDQVTIFGESAGLFNKAIMESGSALCLWSLSKTVKEATFTVGAKLGILRLSSRHLVNALKKVPAKILERATYIVMGVIFARDGPLNGLVFGPVIEAPSDTAVITSSSYEKFYQGDFNRVTLLIGYNSAEAYIFKGLFQLIWFYATRYDLLPGELVPKSMKANLLDLPIIGLKIKEFYTGLNGVLALNEQGMLNYVSDDQFVRPIQKTVRLVSKYVTTYLYKFSYSRAGPSAGANHTDELLYVFDSNFNTTTDIFVRNCTVKLWTNFAKYGDPTSSNGSKVCGGVTLKPITPKDRDTLYYIDINRNVTVGENPDAYNMAFWKDLFDKYANPPFMTY
ncbi:hypothetical protein Trydic_g1305 [Trypoxylus dichotomus]